MSGWTDAELFWERRIVQRALAHPGRYLVDWRPAFRSLDELIERNQRMQETTDGKRPTRTAV